MTAPKPEWVYMSRFVPLAVVDQDGGLTTIEPLSPPEDRTRRTACELFPAKPRTWDPSPDGIRWYEKLSGDAPFTLPSGRTVTPPKGGFYRLWRSRCAPSEKQAPPPASL